MDIGERGPTVGDLRLRVVEVGSEQRKLLVLRVCAGSDEGVVDALSRLADVVFILDAGASGCLR